MLAELEQLKNEFEKNDTIEIDIKVVPGSSKTEISGILGTALKVKVSAPPEKGKANLAVQKLFAEIFNVPITLVTVIKGHTSPRKRIRITKK